MDVYFNLILVTIIIIMFILMKYTSNIFLYIGILMLSVTGLIVATFSPLYLVTGSNMTLVYSGSQLIGAISVPIQQQLSTYNYIFQLYYLMAMIVSIVYWTLETPKKQDY